MRSNSIGDALDVFRFRTTCNGDCIVDIDGNRLPHLSIIPTLIRNLIGTSNHNRASARIGIRIGDGQVLVGRAIIANGEAIRLQLSHRRVSVRKDIRATTRDRQGRQCACYGWFLRVNRCEFFWLSR